MIESLSPKDIRKETQSTISIKLEVPTKKMLIMILIMGFKCNDFVLFFIFILFCKILQEKIEHSCVKKCTSKFNLNFQ